MRIKTICRWRCFLAFVVVVVVAIVVDDDVSLAGGDAPQPRQLARGAPAGSHDAGGAGETGRCSQPLVKEKCLTSSFLFLSTKLLSFSGGSYCAPWIEAVACGIPPLTSIVASNCTHNLLLPSYKSVQIITLLFTPFPLWSGRTS